MEMSEPRKRVSDSEKSGLMFPVGRVRRHLRSLAYGTRLSKSAPVYLAAVLEYAAAELLDLAGTVAQKDHKQRIIPRHIYLAVQKDDELVKLIPEAIIPAGGATENYMKTVGGYRTVEQVLRNSTSSRKKTKARTIDASAMAGTARQLKFD